MACSLFLAREFGCCVLGMSVSPRQVAYAHARAKRQGLSRLVSFVVADAEDCEYPAAVYDLAWVMESSEHFRDRPGFFRRAAKSLRKGGTLLLAAWTANDDPDSKTLARVAEASICPPFSSAQEYSAMLAGAGLEVVASQDLTDSVVRTWDIVCRRVRILRLFSRVAPPPVRDFCKDVELMPEAFRERVVTYKLWVAVRG